MEPTIKLGQSFRWSKLSAGDVTRLNAGQIVVFHPPDSPDKLNVERIAGVPGDELFLERCHLRRNGKVVDEPYTLHTDSEEGKIARFTVPGGCLFLLGDNRHHSADSRVFGCVPFAMIVGLAEGH